MTLFDLNQLQWLPGEAQDLRRRLDELRTDCKRYNLSGQTVEEYRAILYRAKRRSETEARRIRAFIDAIPDQHTRRVFELRFANGLSWQEISAGSFNSLISDEALRKMVYRYIKDHGSEQKGEPLKAAKNGKK